MDDDASNVYYFAFTKSIARQINDPSVVKKWYPATRCYCLITWSLKAPRPAPERFIRPLRAPIYSSLSIPPRPLKALLYFKEGTFLMERAILRTPATMSACHHQHSHHHRWRDAQRPRSSGRRHPDAGWHQGRQYFASCLDRLLNSNPSPTVDITITPSKFITTNGTFDETTETTHHEQQRIPIYIDRRAYFSAHTASRSFGSSEGRCKDRRPVRHRCWPYSCRRENDPECSDLDPFRYAWCFAHG